MRVRYAVLHAWGSIANTLIAQHLPLADHIIILTEDGKIAEQGTWDDLRSEAGYISKVVLKEKSDDPDKPRDRAEAHDKIQTSGPKGPSEEMQDITRKTGDITLYGNC